MQKPPLQNCLKNYKSNPLYKESDLIISVSSVNSVAKKYSLWLYIRILSIILGKAMH